MLTMRKAQIEQTVRDELERVRSIETRIAQTEEQGLLTDDVVLKAMPVRTFLSVRQVVRTREEGFALMAQVHRSLPERPRRSVLGHFALTFHSESFETENVDVEMGFLLDGDIRETLLLPAGRAMTVRTLPAIETMATMVYAGIAHHVRCYGQLGTWIEQNHFQLAGPGWEVFIEPSQPARFDEEAVIEIQLPVTREGFQSRVFSRSDDDHEKDSNRRSML